MQTVFGYSITTGGSVTDADMTAIADQVLPIKNNHLVLSDDFNLRAVYANGANLTRVNFQPPSWEAVNRMNVWPISQNAGVPSNPQMMWLDPFMPQMPKFEEFTAKATDSVNETAYVLLWLQTPGHVANLPQGVLPFAIRFTVTLTLSAGAWVTSGALTFEKSLRGGNYSVLGMQAQCTNGLCARLIAPRMRVYNGRPIRPGFLLQNAIGDVPEPRIHLNPWMWGELMRFHSYEPPLLEVLGNTSGSQTIEGRLFLAYLGGGENDAANWSSTPWN